jgi:hypothetical protein
MHQAEKRSQPPALRLPTWCASRSALVTLACERRKTWPEALVPAPLASYRQPAGLSALFLDPRYANAICMLCVCIPQSLVCSLRYSIAGMQSAADDHRFCASFECLSILVGSVPSAQLLRWLLSEARNCLPKEYVHFRRSSVISNARHE